MLYVTTRNNSDVYTAQRTLSQNRSADGGLFLPFHSPVFSETDIAALKEKNFNSCVAELLNKMFGCKLTGWDMDFTIGRYPVRVRQLRHRILMGECWHNPEWDFARLLRLVRQRIGAVEEECSGSWVEIAIRIAVLFGIYAELLREEVLLPGDKMDVSAVSCELAGPVSAMYARSWGLPIGNIIICCNENSELWNLICHGQFRTDMVSIPTATPLADVTLPANLERMLHACGGMEEVERYLRSCRSGRMYVPSDAALRKLRDGLFVSVISGHRMAGMLPSVYATHGYLLSPYTALAYGGLLDYRAKTGQLRHGLVLADRNPVRDEETVCRCMGITPRKLKDLL